jgi:ribosomal protein S18 acetylase RimI-like enzyme
MARSGAASGEEAALAGVVWIQQIPGNTAIVWAPPLRDETGEALLRAAADFIDARRIPLAQLVVSKCDGYAASLHERAGFPKFAELRYWYADLSHLRKASMSSRDVALSGRMGDLEFLPHAGDELQRLGALLEQTYIGTLDCPRLDGVRPMSDVLEGYRAQGRYSPADWYFVQQGGADIGAVILAEHAGFGNWELVYMGVTPPARGRGRGEQIVRYALATAARRGAERLVLAVDAANAPALNIYRRAGFVEWDRRIVYARLHAAA